MLLFFFINKYLSCIIQLGRDHVILVADAVLWPWRDKYVKAENRKMLAWKAAHTAHRGLVEIHFTIFFNSVVCTGHRLNFNWKTNQTDLKVWQVIHERQWKIFETNWVKSYVPFFEQNEILDTPSFWAKQ